MPALLAVPLAVSAVLLVLLTFPVSMPLIGLLHARDTRRLRTAAASTPCLRCGHILGRAALDAADDAWTAELTELHQRHPGFRARVVRQYQALCTACGTRYRWNDRSRALDLIVHRQGAEADGLASWPRSSAPAAPGLKQ